ncbi:MAG: hypothetical protein ABH823_04805 [bacterium]
MKLLKFLLALLLVVSFSTLSLAGTLNVNSTADTNTSDAYLTLREAILMATNGAISLGRALSTWESAQIEGDVGAYSYDTILFDVSGTITTSSRMHITETAKWLTINGGANKDVVLYGAGLTGHDCFDIEYVNAVKITGLVFKNFRAAIDIYGSSESTTVGPGNVIADSRYGVRISGIGTNSNEVYGNYIGTDTDGTTAAGNADKAVEIREGARYNVIGGTTTNQRNIISGNSGSAVKIDSSDYNTVTGNYVGFDVNGDALSNEDASGIHLEDSSYNVIGNDLLTKGNLVGNCALGMNISGSNTYNVIKGNYIGTNSDGENHGNDVIGVVISTGSESNTFGPNNVVAYNGSGAAAWNPDWADLGSGLAVYQSERNRVTRNSFYANSGPGILFIRGDVENLVVDTASDKYPTIASVDYDGSTTTVTGTAAANATIEIFLTEDTPDTTGRGEGKTYLGTTTSDAAGNWSTTVSAASGSLTATATDSLGTTSGFAVNAAISGGETTTTTLAPGAPTISNFFIGSCRPADGATISARSVVTADIADNSQLTEVELKVNDATISMSSGLSTATVGLRHSFEESSLSAGTYTFEIIATDVDGNITTDTISDLVVNTSGDVRVSGAPITSSRVFDPSQGEQGVISYSLTRDATIMLYIFDLNGRPIWDGTYVSGQSGGRGGANQINWDGKDKQGNSVPNGIYIYKIVSEGSFKASGRIAVKHN